MNTVKKVIAFAVVIFVTFRLIVISVSASFAAPFIASEEITTLLETALIGSGLYTESELEGKSYLELNDLLKDGVNIGQINPKTKYYTDPISGLQFDLMDLLNKPEVQAGIGVSNAVVNNVVGNAVNDWFSSMQAKGEELYDFINPTYNIPIDMQGRGGAYKIPFSNYGNGKIDGYEIYLFDYAEIVDGGGYIYYRFHNVHRDVYHLDGSFWFTRGDNTFVTHEPKDVEERYGDWRFEDGTKFDTDDEAIPVIGEADGVQITPDMLNPDGTVTIDGTTYYPKDFIDLDKFKDTAIIDLLNQILKALENTPVIAEQDKPIVDVDNIEVTVPEELSDFAVPIGIANIFPFCLPWDFVRGIKTLVAKPEVPVFKTEIDLTDFCGFDLGVIPFEISLEKWEPAVIIVRWFFLLMFIIALIILTPKICKGAG
ncbi:MAG: hypothetical protein HDT21_03680 [Ruminococcus sp.]|nr:hypothetical protein [Ruminococcus sp.]